VVRQKRDIKMSEKLKVNFHNSDDDDDTTTIVEEITVRCDK
jgi:hypothetical protein